MTNPSSTAGNDPSTGATTPVGTASPTRTRRSFFRNPWMLVGVVVLVLVSTGAAYAATLGQRQAAEVCGMLSGARHGLPCDIPLPANSDFVASGSGVAPNVESNYRRWKFTVAQPRAQVYDYFVAQLHADGWPCLTTESKSFGGGIITAGKKTTRLDEHLVVVVGGASTYSSDILIQLNDNVPWPAGTSCA